MQILTIYCPSNIVEEAKHQQVRCQNKINYLRIESRQQKWSWINPNPIPSRRMGHAVGRDSQLIEWCRTTNRLKERNSICAWTNATVQHQSPGN